MEKSAYPKRVQIDWLALQYPAYKILSQPLVDSLGRLLIPFGLHITCLKAVSDEALFFPSRYNPAVNAAGPSWTVKLGSSKYLGWCLLKGMETFRGQ